MLSHATARAVAVGPSARRQVGRRIYRALGPVLAVAIPVGLWLALLIDDGGTGFWVATSALVLVVYVALRPGVQSLIWALLAYTFSFGGAQAGSLPDVPTFVPWIGYALIPAVAGLTLLQRRKSCLSRVAVPLVVVAGVAFLGMLLHGASVADWLGWMAHFGRYPLLFLALTSVRIPSETLRRSIQTFWVLAAIQVPTTLVECVVHPDGCTSDQTVGTMFGARTGLMGLVVVVAVVSLLGRASLRRYSVTRIARPMSLLLAPVLGGAGFAMLAGAAVLPLVAVTDWWSSRGRPGLSGRRKPGSARAVLLGCTGIIVLGGFVWVAGRTGGATELSDYFGEQGNPRLTSLAAFTDPLVSASRSRQQFMATTFTWFAARPAQLLFGSIGPRLALGDQASVFGGASPLAEVNLAVGLPPDESPFLTQYPRMLLELGLVGLAAYLWLLWRAFRVVQREARSGIHAPWYTGQYLAFKVMFIIYVVVAPLYVDAWRVDALSLPFWLWAAALCQAPAEVASQAIRPCAS